MNASFAALEDARRADQQLKDMAGRAQGSSRDAIAGAEKKVASFVGAAQRFGAPGGAPSPSFARLNGEFGQLLSYVDSADTAPTPVAQQTFTTLKQQLDQLTNSWNEFKSKDLKALTVASQ
jgi:hypothetical protein